MYCLRDNYVTNADTNVKGRLVFSAITRGFFVGLYLQGVGEIISSFGSFFCLSNNFSVCLTH